MCKTVVRVNYNSYEANIFFVINVLYILHFIRKLKFCTTIKIITKLVYTLDIIILRIIIHARRITRVILKYSKFDSVYYGNYLRIFIYFDYYN